MIRRLRARSALAAALLLSSTAATAQVVNPAHAQQPPVAGERPGDAEEPPNATRLRSWELPAETVVTGERLARYFEEDRVGSYGQPRWTAKRLFPTTRVYVVPAGKLEVEHWTRVKTPKEGPTTVENQAELEIGLPHRFQVDIYYATEKSGREGDLGVSAQKFEVRHALADWGELPLNPTVYVEWVENDAAADAMELKLLLGDELAPGWHWGSNLVYEHQVGDALESVYEITGGLAHTLRDSELSVGAEVKAALVDEHGDRGDYSRELELGPSIRWQPTPAVHFDFAPLFGIGPDSRAADVYLVLGIEI